MTLATDERPGPTAYPRAEVVAHLRGVLDATPPEIAGDGPALVLRIGHAAEARFPGVSADLVLEAIAVIQADDEAAEEDEARERAQIEELVEMCRRHGLPEGMAMGDALHLMAERGEPAAIALLAGMETPAYRTSEALVEAALAAHPAWTREGEHWTLADEATGPVSDDDLVDWLQRTHPREARAIGDAVAASLPGRALHARQAWSLAMARAGGDDAPMIGTSMMIITLIEEADADFLELRSPILANLLGLDADVLEGALRRLEDLGAIIRSPVGIHLSARILETRP